MLPQESIQAQCLGEQARRQKFQTPTTVAIKVRKQRQVTRASAGLKIAGEIRSDLSESFEPQASNTF